MKLDSVHAARSTNRFQVFRCRPSSKVTLPLRIKACTDLHGQRDLRPSTTFQIPVRSRIFLRFGFWGWTQCWVCEMDSGEGQAGEPERGPLTLLKKRGPAWGAGIAAQRNGTLVPLPTVARTENYVPALPWLQSSKQEHRLFTASSEAVRWPEPSDPSEIRLP
jgi:hypothetical protein